MSNGNNGIYASAKAPEEMMKALVHAIMQIPNEDEAQAEENRFTDWEQMDISDSYEQLKGWESSYRVEFDKHLDLQDQLKAEKRRNSRGEEIEDSPQMKAVKRDMNAVTEKLLEKIPADREAFRKSLFSTAAVYDKLIKSCQDYIDGHNPWSSVGKRRKKMVEDLKARALEERRCFSNLGASEHIFHDREDGMYMGNILGNYACLSRMQIIDQDAVQLGSFEKQGDHRIYLEEVMEGSEQKDARRYFVGRDADQLDRPSGHAQAANDLMQYLGVGNLFIQTDTVAVADAQGRRYMGIRKLEAYNEGDKSYEMLLKEYPGKKVNLTFSAEAIRQLSTLQVMLALFGRGDFDYEKNIYFVGEEENYSEDVDYRVSQVYLNYSAGDLFFSGKTDGDDLKEKNKNLPAFLNLSLPGLDKDFATAVLSLRSEDFDFLTGTLLNQKEKKAFASRLDRIQKLISGRMKEEERLPENEKTIMDPGQWRSKDNANRLQNRIWSDNPQLFPGMLRRNQIRQNKDQNGTVTGTTEIHVHIEGADDGTGRTEARYESLYAAYYSRLSAMKSDRDRYLALSDLAFLVHTTAEEEKEAPEVISILSSVVSRLLGEFMSEGVLMEHYAHRMQTFERFREAFNDLARETKEIPKEYIDQNYYKEQLEGAFDSLKRKAEKNNQPFNEDTARREAEDSVKERMMEEYIIFRMQEEQPQIIYEQYRFPEYSFMLVSTLNRTLNPDSMFVTNYLDKTAKAYARSYDQKHGKGAHEKMGDECSRLEFLTVNYKFINKQKREEARQKFLKSERCANAGAGIVFDEKGLLKLPV